MNVRGSHYDPELQMFMDGPREADLARLRFLRWLAEHGLLEHAAAGPPAGAYAPNPLAKHPDLPR